MQQEGIVPDLSSLKRRPIKSSNELITIKPLLREDSVPLLIESSLDSLELPVWIEANIHKVGELLSKHGALLFRGFLPQNQDGLARFMQASGIKVMNYMEGATPRKALGNNVYTSTEFPPEETIALHNENSYVTTWPMKICFACVIAPQERGETPIADVRKVLQRISPAFRQRCEKTGYLLVRNFSEHLSLPWKDSFKVSSREELERYCERAQIELEWKEGDRLRTKQRRPAIAVHPKTGEEVWFNHIAFWHVSSLEKGVREILLSTFTEEGLPYNTYYGDGSPIEDEVIQEIRQAYDDETVKFPWQAGDVLLLDNMLVAHGRSPYSGSRKIVVSMGEPYTRTAA